MRIVTLFMLLVTLSFGEKVVKYAAVIFRHGDRTPVEPYPTDPWKDESLWPVQFGQLTNIGKNQHYLLGKWLRKRYSTLISAKFDPKEIYVRSTDVDRTLMSAQANLAGMYPPSGDAIWNPNITWQPIPVHTMPEKDDEVLAMKRSCPQYKKEKQKYMDSKAYKDRVNKYNYVYNYLTPYVGKVIKDLEGVNDIYNVLYIEELYNFTLPQWTRTIYPEKMREPACNSFATATATPLMSRLMTGPLLKEIAGTMDTVVRKTKSNPLKLSIYSGHDLTIANVLSSLGVYDGNCPVYTATIFFELLQDKKTKEYFIQIWYRNSTDIEQPHLIYIPHCGHTCRYERFLHLYESYISLDWKFECFKQTSPVMGTSLFLGLLIFAYVIYKIHETKVNGNRRGVNLSYSNAFNPRTVIQPNLKT